MFTKYVKYLNTRIRNMKGLIMSIEPSGPGDKFLICLLKEVKEESCRHVLEDDPLQNNCKNLQKKFKKYHESLIIQSPRNQICKFDMKLMEA